jgi:hypothetical protein
VKERQGTVRRKYKSIKVGVGFKSGLSLLFFDCKNLTLLFPLRGIMGEVKSVYNTNRVPERNRVCIIFTNN